MGVIVIAMYRPKPGRDDALLACVRDHLPVLRQRGLITDRTPIVMRSENGTILEVFEWLNQDAIDRAHHDPEVGKLWARFNEACEYGTMSELPEVDRVFPGFVPVEVG